MLPFAVARKSTVPMAKSPLFVVPVDFSRDMEGTVQRPSLSREDTAPRSICSKSCRRVARHSSVTRTTQAGSKGNKSRLEHAIKTAAHAPIAVRTVSHRGDAATIIPSYMQLVKARLLVIGQHYGTPRWRRNARLVGTLCRAAPGPVLVLPPGVTAKTTARAFGHILSAVDFTVASAVAVRTTIGLIRQTGARLTLVHALKNAPHRTVFSGSEAARAARNLRGQAAHMAERLRRNMPADVRIRVDARVTTGDPHHGILAVASDVKADLIVMGVPPRRRLDEVLFGSTLRNVLRRTKIPVLVLPVLAGAYKWLDVNDGV